MNRPTNSGRFSANAPRLGDTHTVFVRTQTSGGRTYLLVVEKERVNDRVVQRVRHRLGRLDQLRPRASSDTLLKGLGPFSDNVLGLRAHARREYPEADADRWPSANRRAVGVPFRRTAQGPASVVWVIQAAARAPAARLDRSAAARAVGLAATASA